MPIRTTRLSTNTASPAVPEESRFDEGEVLDLRNASTRVPDEFMTDRPLNTPFTKKTLFGNKP